MMKKWKNGHQWFPWACYLSEIWLLKNKKSLWGHLDHHHFATTSDHRRLRFYVFFAFFFSFWVSFLLVNHILKVQIFAWKTTLYDNGNDKSQQQQIK